LQKGKIGKSSIFDNLLDDDDSEEDEEEKKN